MRRSGCRELDFRIEATFTISSKTKNCVGTSLHSVVDDLAEEHNRQVKIPRAQMLARGADPLLDIHIWVVNLANTNTGTNAATTARSGEPPSFQGMKWL